MTPDDEAAIERMVERLKRVDATFAGWTERRAARAVLMREDPEAYAGAVRRSRS